MEILTIAGGEKTKPNKANLNFAEGKLNEADDNR